MNDILLELFHRYGYGLIALVIGLESTGVPLPGEALLVAASLYAAATDRVDIALIVTAAAAGAIIGDNVGYALGRHLGFPLLVRHGNRVGLTPGRLILGRYLFERHGPKIVFFGRFTALLRALAALLAGANAMPWRVFMLWNAIGGVIWASVFGFGAYWLGARILRLATPVGIAVGLASVGIAGALAWALHRRGTQLEAHAIAVMTARDARATRPGP